MGRKYTDNNGFLHLEETPVSRVQIAPYLGKQIDAAGKLKDDDGNRLLEPNKIYYVYRSAEELFNPETMKSFEGMPFRVGHQMLGKGTKKKDGTEAKVDNTPIDGTFLNVHRSKERPDYLVADIIVYTDRAKNAIANGTKELSLGYRCAYLQDDGEYKGTPYQFRQTNIKANHLALVPHGRAGSSVCVQDEAIVDDDGLVVTCDSLPEEIQIMEENEKKAKDKLAALLKGSEENVQDCLDYCDLTEEQKKAIKDMKSKKTDEAPAEDTACKGCGKDEMPAPTPPPAVEEKKDENAEKPEGETAAAPASEEAPAPAPAEAAAPAEKTEPAAEAAPVEEKKPEETEAEDKAPCPNCKSPKAADAKDEVKEEPKEEAPVVEKVEEKATFTQDELDAACKKAAKEARKDALRAKALAEAVGEDADVDETEAQVARKACKKIKGLEQYAEDSRPDGEVLAAIRGHLAKQVQEDEDKPKSKKKILTVAQDEAIAKTPTAFSAVDLNKYLGAH